MSLLKRLTSRLFFRNMLDTLGFGKSYTTEPGGFTPFFQYEIGSYNAKDYTLCFEREPFAVRYKNEIFNKLFRYTVNDGKAYLAFHFEKYPDKAAFLGFLRDEISERLVGPGSKGQKLKLSEALAWVNQKEQQDLPLEDMKLDGTQFGKIRVNDVDQMNSIIQVLYMLRTLDSTPTGQKKLKSTVKLFGAFSGTDVAAIIRFHFNGQKDKQINTIQKMVSKADAEAISGGKRFDDLRTALHNFIYGPK